MLKRVRISVNGVVQGVGYRYFAHRAARRIGLTGFVRNMPDGRVLAEAQGEDREILIFLADLRRGPSASHVTAINVDETAVIDGEASFEIRF